MDKTLPTDTTTAWRSVALPWKKRMERAGQGSTTHKLVVCHITITNKRGTMDHIGFGDELITLTYSKNMKELKRLLKLANRGIIRL